QPSPVRELLPSPPAAPPRPVPRSRQPDRPAGRSAAGSASPHRPPQAARSSPAGEPLYRNPVVNSQQGRRRRWWAWDRLVPQLVHPQVSGMGQAEQELQEAVRGDQEYPPAENAAQRGSQPRLRAFPKRPAPAPFPCRARNPAPAPPSA